MLASVTTLALLINAGCKPPGGAASKYETTTVARGDLVQHVTASGTLSALVSVDVGSQVNYVVDYHLLCG